MNVINAGASRPSIEIHGTIAYAGDHPWILNETVRKNITLDEHYDEDKYQEAVKHACLKHDIEQLVAGDETEIGKISLFVLVTPQAKEVST